MNIRRYLLQSTLQYTSKGLVFLKYLVSLTPRSRLLPPFEPACWRTTSADARKTLPRERPANPQEQPFASMSASADAQEQGAPAAGARAPATADFLRMPGNDMCFDCHASCAVGTEP